MSLSQLDDDVILLRGRLAQRERELAAVREAATDAAEAAASRLHAAQREAFALRCAMDEAHALATAEPEPEPEPRAGMPMEIVVAEAVPPSSALSLPGTVPAAPPRRSLRRVMVLPVWRLVRPVARPLLWRARSFLTADAVREITALRAAQEEMQDMVRDAAREAVLEALNRVASPAAACAKETSRRASGPSHGLGLGDTAGERWLLTVALEGARAQAWLDAQPA